MDRVRSFLPPLVIVLVAGLLFSSSVQADPADKKLEVADHFTTQGSTILDPYGKEFVPVGANVGAPVKDPNGDDVWLQRTQGHDASTPEFAEAIEKWNWNTLRINAACNNSEKIPHDNMFEAIDKMVDLYTSKEVVVMIECHDLTGDDPAIDSADYQAVAEFWRSAAVKYGDNPYVWFNHLNEFATRSDQTYWQSIIEDGYSLFDSAGAKNLVVFDLPGFGQHLETMTNPAVQAWAAEMCNVVWDLHSYGSAGLDETGDYTTAFGQALQQVQDAGVPLVIGEIGYDWDPNRKHANAVSYDHERTGALAAIEHGERLNIGVLAWHANGDAGEKSTYNLMQGDTATAQDLDTVELSEFGQAFWNYSQQNGANKTPQQPSDEKPGSEQPDSEPSDTDATTTTIGDQNTTQDDSNSDDTTPSGTQQKSTSYAEDDEDQDPIYKKTRNRNQQFNRANNPEEDPEPETESTTTTTVPETTTTTPEAESTTTTVEDNADEDNAEKEGIEENEDQKDAESDDSDAGDGKPVASAGTGNRCSQNQSTPAKPGSEPITEPETSGEDTTEPNSGGAMKDGSEVWRNSEPVLAADESTPNDQLPVGEYLDEGKADNDSSPTEGQFRIICAASHMSFDDPVVFPGQTGAAHNHTFFGNTGTDANSTDDSMYNSGGGSCSGGPLNRSGYWFPTLFAGDKAVVPSSIVGYYKSKQPDDVVVPPAGLRVLTGADPSNPGFPESNQLFWSCGGSGSDEGRTNQLPDCQNNGTLNATIAFPQCWDGQNLDSDDHRSHVKAVGEQDPCPSSHPVRFPQVRFLVYWDVSDLNHDQLLLSSDLHTGNQATPGTTLHADGYFNWHPEAGELWINGCIKARRNCSGGQTGHSDKQLKSIPKYEGTKLVELPPMDNMGHLKTPGSDGHNHNGHDKPQTTTTTTTTKEDTEN